MKQTMKRRRIGEASVSAIGLGGMGMSIEGRPEEARSVATIHAALDEGITLIDTADAYHVGADEVGHNECLIARALASYGGDTAEVLVATKGGHLRPGDGSWTRDGSPEHLRQACEASLHRLGVEAIGLYYFHRPDLTVPYEDSIGAIRDLLDAGKIRMAGVSNADTDQIRSAQEILGGRLAAVQNQFSPAYRSTEPEMELCDELGIAFLPWSPLALSPARVATDAGEGLRTAANLGAEYRPFAEVGQEIDATPQQVALAWILAKSPVVIPIPGSSRPETIRASAAAVDLELTPEQIGRLNQD